MPSILGANTLSSGYDVANSLRFNDGDSPALTRSLGTTTLATKGTFSFWVKRGQLTTAQIIYSNEVADDNNRAFIQFEDDDTFRIKDTVSGSNTTHYATTQKFRDVGAWYHMVVALDSTEAGGNRIRVYKNGTRIPDAQFGTSTEPNQNSDFKLLTGGQTNKNHIGKIHGGANHFDGYLAEFVYCDGQVLDASSFGEFDSDSGIWKPIDVSGLTFGDQGFYLDFEDSSSLGNDKAGSNNFGTVTNLAATDQSTDTCTLNYSTLNFLATSSYNDLSEGGLKVTGNTATNDGETFSTFVMPNATAKWYWELKCTNKQSTGNPKFGFIQAKRGFRLQNGGAGYGGAASGTLDIMVRPDGKTLENGSTSGSAVIGTWDTGDILSFALDSVNGAFYVGINGTWQTSGDPTSGSSKTGAVKTWTTTDSKCDDGQAVCIGSYNGSVTEANFGSPSFSISSGNTDGNGYGNFEYSVPSGYYSLNTKNLAEYG